MTIVKKILIAFFGTSLLVGVISTILSPPRSTQSTQRAKEDEKPKFSTMIASCQVEWEMARKKKLHNPSSLDWDHRSAELGMYKGKTPVISVPYRATNAYGAVIVERALCAIDPDSRKVLSVIK